MEQQLRGKLLTLEKLPRPGQSSINSTMQSVTLVILACILVAHVEGKGSNVMKCFCQDKGVDRVNRKLVGKLEVHAPSSYCPQLEIIIFFNKGGKVCLNPESQMAKNLVQKASRNRSVIYVSWT
ncbi:C-X-C motif chemokine 10-like [Hypomesus transpacificus]|uniref:C-X-C motif chemokine 10-like n=1 Tax=Hypomesus transpacificus TaxID=137520 RepID=UPI001F0760F0|nr:C-X-C motif chemokine 10-like [Hypomesus transpacificus]